MVQNLAEWSQIVPIGPTIADPDPYLDQFLGKGAYDYACAQKVGQLNNT